MITNDRMNAHNHLHRRHANPDPAPVPDPQQTIVSVVYVTAAPTFTGAIAGYSTLGVASPTSSEEDVIPQAAATSTTAAAAADETITTDSTQSSSETQTTLQTLTSAAVLSSSTPATSSLLASTTSDVDFSETSSASATSTPTSVASSGGMSSSGKAGLAIGLLIVIGGVLGLILFCFKKSKRSSMRGGMKLPDEKYSHDSHDSQDSHEFQTIERPQPQQGIGRQIGQEMLRSKSITSPTAPRLSFKRTSQFLPDLTVKPKRLSPVVPLSPVTSEPESRPTTSHSNSQENPFGNHAETIDFTNANGPSVVGLGPGGEIVAQTPAQIYRNASKSGPKPLDFTKNGPFMGPPSPAGTEFSSSSDPNPASTPMGDAIAAAGGPPNSAVHRVQLDFNPSMGDELELRAGQLVRLLHEYDDGWAMCIRLDRSQQGVVPRTCLSTRPVKPRPQDNPRAPAGIHTNQQYSQTQQSRPLTPQGQASRPLSPANRPLTPTSQRPLTPQGQSRPTTPQGGPRGLQAPGSRSQKPVQFDGPSSSPPTGPLPVGPVSRKPVPGQAL